MVLLRDACIDNVKPTKALDFKCIAKNVSNPKQINSSSIGIHYNLDGVFDGKKTRSALQTQYYLPEIHFTMCISV